MATRHACALVHRQDCKVCVHVIIIYIFDHIQTQPTGLQNIDNVYCTFNDHNQHYPLELCG